MARYEHLPIYKAALDAAVHFEQVVACFSRYHKYSLGTELRHASRAVVEQVIRANSARERMPELIRLRDGLERVLVLLRLAKEVKAFRSFQAYQHAAELVVKVCRQNEGWIRSVEQGSPMRSSRRKPETGGGDGLSKGA
ncbi:MAG TPA: four helix bundle protein [Thiobacillaceae bacterium]|nr:four helix bundle protein [Thiobacillaceae bacterium]